MRGAVGNGAFGRGSARNAISHKNNGFNGGNGNGGHPRGGGHNNANGRNYQPTQNSSASRKHLNEAKDCF